MAQIRMRCGAVVLVDDADLPILSQYGWHIHDSGNHTVYAKAETRVDGVRRVVLMHRMLLSAPKGVHVDHIDGNGLNNQRSNLRLCTNAENGRNRRAEPIRAKSGFRGVGFAAHYKAKPWYAEIMVDRRHFRRHFVTMQEAVAARDEMAKAYHGEFAVVSTEDIGPKRPALTGESPDYINPHCKPVRRLSDGAVFPSVKDAAEASGTFATSIARAIKLGGKTAGSGWQYEG
jgi:hypothetical protein